MTINPSLYFLTFLVWRLVKLRDLVGQDARDRTAKTENPVYWSTFFSPKPNGNRLATQAKELKVCIAPFCVAPCL